ncbi:MAG: prepilin-type N-terminal cleavage/methylation domain-containing protein [Myxococcaceae bacterium]|nr:prepilin-type N-terminal cleavage/methylation domain-containing protein [Myxococcaceae bacterium]MCA3015604.1 prepilin-type N-terminal cleavage/methylation domain-containing protein [Myxococcaceae bacterium]
MTKKKGFTLIELMIVVAIIGILAAIAIPNFVKFQAKGKQAEASANLKAIFSAQKAAYPNNQGYWSDVGAIGFAPERGNRYRYDLGPTAMTVADGMEGVCGQLTMRENALQTQVAGDCGYQEDQAKHGANLLMGIVLQGTASFLAEVPGNDMLGDRMEGGGVNGDMCPNCDFAAGAVSNIDNDLGADSWIVSSQTISTDDVAGCPPGMNEMNMNAYTSGSPAPITDDTCFESM